MANNLVTKNDLFVLDKETNEMILSEQAIDAILEIETQRKQLDKEYKAYREALLDGMETYGLKKCETDDLVVTYVEPTERIGIDNDKLWAEYKNIAFKCQKFTPVNSSVRVKVR